MTAPSRMSSTADKRRRRFLAKTYIEVANWRGVRVHEAVDRRRLLYAMRFLMDD